jgi:AcrR family transcriptional regulator
VTRLGGRATSSFSALPAAPPTERGQRTRARLIRAAEVVFGNVGYHDARVSEITREAGVALGTFYLYFPSKEELFRAMLAGINHDLRRTLSEGTRGLQTRAEMEAEGLRLFFHFLRRHRKLYRIVKQAEGVDPALYQEYYRRIARGYQRGLAQAMERGELKRVDPELAAYALMGVADFVASRYIIWEEGLTQAKFDQLVEILLYGLVADGGTRRPTPSIASPSLVPPARPRRARRTR